MQDHYPQFAHKPEDVTVPRNLFMVAERAKYRYMLLGSFFQWIDVESGCTRMKQTKCPCHNVVHRARLQMRSVLTSRADPFTIDEYAGAQLMRALEIESWLSRLYEDGMCLRSVQEDDETHNFEFMLREWISECTEM